ncbi:hypothetical protein ACEWY4_000198 [Coilia grayii]|uniref:Lymphoid-restricted membrane protein-like n=1 Tax=Coilia grayii TaxID=363190 RepID=A0ABD1KVY3_9TELE
MNVQRQNSTVKSLSLSNTGLSSEEDSDEDALQEELIASLNQLSILERLGPTSEEMTEGEVESAFSQLALAFRCDQYTLDQRLQTEEHARNKAEENLHLELQRGKEAIEALKGMCLDRERFKALQKLDFTLDILAGTVDQVARTAEVLGAVHQEAKVSRAVELMLAHVENLRQRHERHSAELEETRKLINSTASYDQPLPDFRGESFFLFSPFVLDTLILLSCAFVALLFSFVQEIKKPKDKDGMNEGTLEEKVTQRHAVQLQSTEPKAAANPKMEDVERVPGEDSCKHHTSPVEGATELTQAPSDAPTACPLPSAVYKHDEVNPSMPYRPPAQRVIRRRQKSRTELDGFSSRGRRERHGHGDCDTNAPSPFTRIFGRQHLPVHWLYHCRWILTCVYVTVLVSIILLAIFFWFVRTPVLWM